MRRDPAFAPAFADALRAWARLGAALDLPGAGHAAADERLLEQLR